MPIEIHEPWQTNYLIISCAMEWAFIRRIRAFVGEFIDASVKTDTLHRRISMVANELLENAVKYSIDPEVHLELHLTEPYKDDNWVKLEVINKGKESHIKRLKSTIEEIKQGNPVEAYLKRMKAVFEQKISEEESQLGLARIRCEGRADIDLKVLEENKVSIVTYLPY